ncbi:hypothetical protein [Marinobacter qingdaonensis]|uniref:Uncharacterized protein n=1 Tax=Marinobacter qingdaonensis TaxID=3108486 RepID=A0ABU5NVH1_9GAMM|nr:hypothetical protein [Marinobacter sp. ASW11-75]MEA1079808.1 hypothetical protein [Marinobacter sp. ASW11-75]
MRVEPDRGPRLPALVLFGLVSLAVSGPAGAHGAPDADKVPAGVVKASITEQPGIPGLSTLILDAPRPGILLSYRGNEPITILGTEGEAFLRFSPDRVEAYTGSASWQALPEATVSKAASTEAGAWITLSNSNSFGWLDPRLNALEGAHGDAGEFAQWRIPIRSESGPVRHLRGELSFESYSTAP